MGGEFRPAVGGYVEGNAMLRENVSYEGVSDIYSGCCISCRYEYALLGEAVDNYKDRVKPFEDGSCSMKSILIECQGRLGIGSG